MVTTLGASNEGVASSIYRLRAVLALIIFTKLKKNIQQLFSLILILLIYTWPSRVLYAPAMPRRGNPASDRRFQEADRRPEDARVPEFQ